MIKKELGILSTAFSWAALVAVGYAYLEKDKPASIFYKSAEDVLIESFQENQRLRREGRITEFQPCPYCYRLDRA